MGSNEFVPGKAALFSKASIALAPAPIEASWIRRGNPTARAAILWGNPDRSACTAVWDCTPGEFDWHYDVDETVHILEGSVVLDDGITPPRRVGRGDVVLFPAGAVVRWTVETHVRKLAFFHRPAPRLVALAYRIIRKGRAILGRPADPIRLGERAMGAPGANPRAGRGRATEPSGTAF